MYVGMLYSHVLGKETYNVGYLIVNIVNGRILFMFFPYFQCRRMILLVPIKRRIRTKSGLDSIGGLSLLKGWIRLAIIGYSSAATEICGMSQVHYNGTRAYST
jgi:hypothetical protein